MRVTAQDLKDCSSESFLWADYHMSLLCSRMDQRSLLPYKDILNAQSLRLTNVAVDP